MHGYSHSFSPDSSGHSEAHSPEAKALAHLGRCVQNGAGVALLLLFTTPVGPQSQFVRVAGGGGYDIGHSLGQTADGGYAMAGFTDSYGGGYDVLLAKFDSLGYLEWARTAGGTSDEMAHALLVTADGGYVVTGETQSFGAGSKDVLVLRFDSAGGFEWARTLGGLDDDVGHYLARAEDGGYLIAGSTQSDGAGSADVLVAKFDSLGNWEWAWTVGGSEDDVAYCLVPTADSGYVIAGETRSFGTEQSDILICKFSGSGILEWARSVGDGSADVAYSLVGTQDGGYAVAGETFGSGETNYDVLLAKLDSWGNHVWTRRLGGTDVDRALSLVQTEEGRYTLAGTTRSFGATCQDVLLVQYDSTGSHEWTRFVGGISVDGAYSLIHARDGAYVIAGEAKSFGTGLYDLFLVKFDSSGNSCLSEPAEPLVDSISPSVAVITPAVEAFSPEINEPVLTVSAVTLSMTHICETREFIRADANGDMVHSVADAICIIGYIYRAGQCECRDCYDANDDGKISNADAVYVVSYVYRSGPPPADPFPSCGVDLTADGLGCFSHRCMLLRTSLR